MKLMLKAVCSMMAVWMTMMADVDSKLDSSSFVVLAFAAPLVSGSAKCDETSPPRTARVRIELPLCQIMMMMKMTMQQNAL